VQVYDAGFMSGSNPNPDLTLANGQSITTVYRLFKPDNVFSPLGASTTYQTTTVTSSNSAYSGWRSMGTITSPIAGETYYLQVYTTNTTSSAGSNGFAVRAANNGSFSACSADAAVTVPSYTASCVQVHGYSDLSIFANLSGTTAEFYLAQVGAQYAGKTMSVSLFDLGEGAALVEVLDPNGDEVQFDWSTPCTNPPAPATNGCTGNDVWSLNPNTQSASQPYPRTSSSYIYNDRSLTLTVALPTDYAAKYGTKEWWKIRYTVASAPTDRTTWSVNINGSPVHLVN
jgi:hypothetical protein